MGLGEGLEIRPSIPASLVHPSTYARVHAHADVHSHPSVLPSLPPSFLPSRLCLVPVRTYRFNSDSFPGVVFIGHACDYFCGTYTSEQVKQVLPRILPALNPKALTPKPLNPKP